MIYLRNAWPDSSETLHRYLFLHDLQFIFHESLDPSNFVFWAIPAILKNDISPERLAWFTRNFAQILIFTWPTIHLLWVTWSEQLCFLSNSAILKNGISPERLAGFTRNFEQILIFTWPTIHLLRVTWSEQLCFLSNPAILKYLRNAWPDSCETLHRYLFLHDLQFIFCESLDPSNFVFWAITQF
jgi:hypothetical protein